MQPDDTQQNYWQDDTPPGDESYPTETYQPGQENPVDNSTLEQGAEPLQEQEPNVEAQAPEEVPVAWTAREYVQLDKGFGWYVLFALVALALIATDIFILRSYTFSVLVVVMSVALIVYARRPAREIQYTLSGKQGLYVGERLYHLSEFKAFGLIKDGDHHSIMLIPIKRFAPGVSVYFPEEAGEQIVDILGQRLPMETLKLDIIDVLVRKLRL